MAANKFTNMSDIIVQTGNPTNFDFSNWTSEQCKLFLNLISVGTTKRAVNKLRAFCAEQQKIRNDQLQEEQVHRSNETVQTEPNVDEAQSESSMDEATWESSS